MSVSQFRDPEGQTFLSLFQGLTSASIKDSNQAAKTSIKAKLKEQHEVEVQKASSSRNVQQSVSKVRRKFEMAQHAYQELIDLRSFVEVLAITEQGKVTGPLATPQFENEYKAYITKVAEIFKESHSPRSRKRLHKLAILPPCPSFASTRFSNSNPRHREEVLVGFKKLLDSISDQPTIDSATTNKLTQDLRVFSRALQPSWVLKHGVDNVYGGIVQEAEVISPVQEAEVISPRRKRKNDNVIRILRVDENPIADPIGDVYAPDAYDAINENIYRELEQWRFQLRVSET